MLAETTPVPFSLPIHNFIFQPPKNADGILPEEVFHIGFTFHNYHLGAHSLNPLIPFKIKLDLSLQLIDALCLLQKHHLFHQNLTGSHAQFTSDFQLKLFCYTKIDSILDREDGENLLAQNVSDVANIIIKFYFDKPLIENPHEIALKALLDRCLDPDLTKRPKSLDLFLQFKEIVDRIKS